MRVRPLRFQLLLPVCFCMAIPVAGQVANDGSLNGRVLDATGASVTGAVLTLTHNSTKRASTATTDAEGSYTFAPVPPGSYTVEARAPGFTPLVRENVLVAPGGTRLDLTLIVAPLIELVTVTAQRREESQLDVPISVTSVTRPEIESRYVTRTADVLEATPNVVVTPTSGSLSRTNISIRGIGGIVENTDQATAVYVDDVFIGGFGAFNQDLLDAERVEVLRGPQGTLYGRNALAGAVNFISTPPSDEFSTDIDLRYGSYNFFTARGTLNAPLVRDKVLSRLTFAATRRNGTVLNRFDGTHINDLGNVGGRAQLRLIPSARLDIRLIGDYSNDKTTRYAYGPYDDVVNQRTSLFNPFDEDRRIYGFSGRVDYRLPGVTLTSLSAARGVSFDGVGSDFSDTNFIHQGFDYRQRQVSQELRVVSTSPRRLRYVAGVFYYRERNSVFNFASLVSGFPQFGFQPGYLESADAVVKTDSAAVFGDASLAVADRVTLTAGARYTHEWKHLDYTQANNAGVPGFFAPARSVRDEASYDNVSPRLAVRYNLAPNQAVYASVSRGYKGGGFNTVFVGAQDFRFDDEKAWSYEAGVKAARLDGRLMLNAAVFRFDWTDQQVSIFNGFFSTTTNANRSRSVGGEIEVAAHPSNSVDLSAGVGFADATFVDLKNFVPGEDADGKRQPFASKVTTMLSAQYRFTNWRGPAVRTRADYAYRSSLFFDVANTLAQPGVQLVNVNVALEGRRADLVFFVNNLFDEQYRVTGFLLPSGPLAAPGDPRTFGIGTRVRFR